MYGLFGSITFILSYDSAEYSYMNILWEKTKDKFFFYNETDFRGLTDLKLAYS